MATRDIAPVRAHDHQLYRDVSSPALGSSADRPHVRPGACAAVNWLTVKLARIAVWVVNQAMFTNGK